jgi:N-acetylated-alpha-linked acidic dipeptidase
LPAATGRELVSNRLGSGSDYTVFLNHIGVPVADLSFTGAYGVYHSMYDDHAWMTRFGDPGFRYHAAMARLWGIVALRLANADVLPFEYLPYAARLREFYDELRARASPAERQAMRPAADAIDRFANAARRADARAAAATATDRPDAERRAIDRGAMAAERAFIAVDGLRGRPWYRHLVYAPQPTYAPELLPGMAEAIDAHDAARVEREAARLAAALDRAAAVLAP